MDTYRIDSHKLIYHVPRVNDWLEGKSIYPIYMEVSPAGSCNHRCTYCGLDFMRYKRRYLDTELWKKRLSELAKLGLKSIMYAGEGEPFLHKDIVEIVAHTKNTGIDSAITTNGVLLTPKKSDAIITNLEWVKVGVDAATADTYQLIHGCDKGDFNKVIENISYIGNMKKKKNHKCVLGVQLLLLPENAKEVKALAKLAKDIGADYLVVKPYSQHPKSKKVKYRKIEYKDYEYLADELSELNTDKFSVIFRGRAMKKWDAKRSGYRQCLALPFWSHVDAGGNVWGCGVYLEDMRFFYGNIYKKSFKSIWEGNRRIRSLRFVEDRLDASKCRINCRMDEINRYLWELKNPPAHVNFI